mmetsp:Transcript_597/g.1145  ORF Transcript_597/g.1145 Transcript_597/m.1145 type:complete len:149 (-) Transcript_597:41-487(-)
MGKLCLKLKPSACLECISGEMTGLMLDFMTYKSTLILYGILSDKPAGGVNTVSFIGKAQTIESFLLFEWLSHKSADQYRQIFGKAQNLYKTSLKTVIQGRYGLHQIEEAVKFYLKNQTAGKIVLKPSLTGPHQSATHPVNLDAVVAKL